LFATQLFNFKLRGVKMKKTLKKFFLLGVAIGMAGFAASHAKQIEKHLKEFVAKKKLSKEDAANLNREIMGEIDKLEFKKVRSKKAAKKPAKKKAVAKKKPVKKTRKKSKK
jgi:polyhydroxyalkanoate synthesis regulator phasin